MNKSPQGYHVIRGLNINPAVSLFALAIAIACFYLPRELLKTTYQDYLQDLEYRDGDGPLDFYDLLDAHCHELTHRGNVVLFSQELRARRISKEIEIFKTGFSRGGLMSETSCRWKQLYKSLRDSLSGAIMKTRRNPARNLDKCIGINLLKTANNN